MELESYSIYLLLLLPLAAFLYASVGHGGASSYLVVLSMMGFAPTVIKPTALVLNIAISAISFLWFFPKSTFPKRLFLLLILFSVPASFLGGTYHLELRIYKIILGILLLFPIVGLLNIIPLIQSNKTIGNQNWIAPILGFTIGFLSGLIGIGGGILLSPILLLFGWSDMKQTASISALFIFFNSISGLLGSGVSLHSFPLHFEWMLPLTILGGSVGAYLGARKYSIPFMKKVLALVLLIASYKLIVQ